MKFKMNKKGNSGIYIKPENRGKFTATKKATGKTTEELTHSKNPITKKRAIFAQNAAKWKHEDGSKNVKGFPDLNKDGEITKADILKGRGVIKNGGKSMKTDEKMCGSKGMKYQTGSSNVSMNLNDSNKIPKPIEKTKKFISNNTKTNTYSSTKNDESVEARKIPAYVDKKQSVVIKPKTSIYDSDKSDLLNKKLKYAEGTKGIKFKKKPMMKRADGSTSQRGLWDNIRANKGSGKKPTPEMLKQEKKIKAGK